MQTIDTARIARSYLENGYYFPIDVMNADDTAGYRRLLKKVEDKSKGMRLGNKKQLNYPHVIYRFANEIARNSVLLDAVEAIIRPDIMLWGSTFFFKESHTQSYVSRHQDLRYWGLQDHEAMVSARLALAPANRANGCMRSVPGSHMSGLVTHKDTYDEKNLLTRGQEVEIDIDESTVVYVKLEPGQVSFHHGHLLHASSPNDSDTSRLGYTMNFIAPHNRQNA